ncbi:MAG: hypothetical protein ABEJ42_03025 [Halobacteriaceae archaeon]
MSASEGGDGASGSGPDDVEPEPAPESYPGPAFVDPEWLGPAVGFGLGAGTVAGFATGEYWLWLPVGLLAGLVAGLAAAAVFGPRRE